MAKIGEINYLKNLGRDGVRHAVNKPFSDPACGGYLAEVGAMLALLPPPPARLLDVGCGTGWTSVFFARAGYEVVGIDIADDMIFHAEQNRARTGLDNLRFLVSDYEDMGFDDEFDAVVFFDALHHAVDEGAAIREAFRVLKRGGLCLTSEPGKGHQHTPPAQEAVLRYGVTEKDMEPEKVIALGRLAGFRRFRVYPRAFQLHNIIYRHGTEPPTPLRVRASWWKRLLYRPLLRRLGIGPGSLSRFMGSVFYFKHLGKLFHNVPRGGGIVAMVK
jgi:SAM-dependent methyltransferase